MKVNIIDINGLEKRIESDLIIFIKKMETEVIDFDFIETGDKFIYNIQITKNNKYIEHNNIKNPIKRIREKLKTLISSTIPMKTGDLYNELYLIMDSIMKLEDKVNKKIEQVEKNNGIITTKNK